MKILAYITYAKICQTTLGVQVSYLGCHDELVVDYVVRSIAHTEQGTCWVHMAWHASSYVDILSKSLWKRTGGS